MNIPQSFTKNYTNLISEIENGQIKIPQFQREYVWELESAAKLIDSLLKGYPIGTFIFWRTNEKLRSIRNFGDLKLPPSKDGEYADYVLDGQQRLTSLFACLKGAKIERSNGSIDDFSQIYVKLDVDDENENIVVTDTTDLKEGTFINMLTLMNGKIKDLKPYLDFEDNIDKYKSLIQSYQFPIIQLKDTPIDIATEVFTRINVGGKSLSVFEIMVAKTFDDKKEFDLSEKYDNLIERLSKVSYETISESSILQLISLILTKTKECKRQVILKLEKDKFIDTWDNAVNAIERAVDFFRATYRIPVSQLLPYNTLIVPFAYFFYYQKDKPKGEQAKYLEDFFWRCSLGGRYSSAVESKLAQDIKRIDSILDNKQPKYDWSIDTSPEFIQNNGWFSAGRSYIKAILCLYAYKEPKSFNDDSKINIDNSWLKQANSKNYHHFFPKAFLKGKGEDEFYINHILNITIVDDFLNKREIGAKAPSKYMKIFQEQNDNLAKTMKTHLIGDLEKFGIWNDDYDTFFTERSKLLSKEMNKKLLK
ncbi:hypothetical protein EDC44_10679 [Cricetibacter osteomyelitidis]|uniref:GmrSD restriction endonucleases N-terminal domain-containing protein n=1 Tax=Cricetibacter osteomyelitidis TaxID=1521931 RepID=A0A4R2T1K9_9PAST|nr:DUF262 domain-containing protein [Cricetibacter osteomyelitidis]TCP96020.1 hypothetical protein EDC44_10679 [Cricetibacter osteomyelitidis]